MAAILTHEISGPMWTRLLCSVVAWNQGYREEIFCFSVALLVLATLPYVAMVPPPLGSRMVKGIHFDRDTASRFSI